VVAVVGAATIILGEKPVATSDLSIIAARAGNPYMLLAIVPVRALLSRLLAYKVGPP